MSFSDDLELAILIHASADKVYNGQFERARKLLSMCRHSSSLSGNTLQKLVFYFAEALPFCRIAEFTAMQYILDNVASAKKVHLIDLGIRIGSHWPVLLQGIQALADQSECPMLKLTDEALAICSELRLSSLLPWPDQLENFLQTIANLHPKAFVTTELDANTNTCNFIDRFNEAINLASAVMDCIEDCLEGNTPCKAIIEHVFVREAIQNVITAEGEERVHRHQKIDTWREILSKHGFTEVPPSEFARNQAKILINNNPRWSGCTVDSDGQCMIVGWRGNPIKSVSAWTSQHVI